MTIPQLQRLRELIVEYGKLHRLEGHTPQSRGRRLNGFVAEVLQSWGVDASESISGDGEIDVGFEIGDTRFVLEAKWEKEPVDTEGIAKLQKRVRQRLGGTLGLFLSLSGYTGPAVHDVKQGERLEVLLLTSEHLEALVSGFSPPDELFPRLLQRASYVGDPAPSLIAALSRPRSSLDEIDFNSGSLAIDWSKALSVKPRVLLSNLPFGQWGVTETGKDHLVVTLADGIADVDIEARKIYWRLPLPWCYRNPLRVDESLFFVRRHAVASLTDSRVRIVAGAFASPQILTLSASGELLTLCSSMEVIGGPDVVPIWQVGDTLGGEQQITTLPYPAHNATNAAHLPDGRFLITGGGGIRVIAPDGETRILDKELTNVVGLGSVVAHVFSSGEWRGGTGQN